MLFINVWVKEGTIWLVSKNNSKSFLSNLVNWEMQFFSVSDRNNINTIEKYKSSSYTKVLSVVIVAVFCVCYCCCFWRGMLKLVLLLSHFLAFFVFSEIRAKIISCKKWEYIYMISKHPHYFFIQTFSFVIIWVAIK